MKERIRINNKIFASELRVIGPDNQNVGVISREEALSKARELGLDLIEISPNATPPVAKIMDYGKFRYEQKKKDKSSKTPSTEIKSLQIRIGTSEHDLELKAKQTGEFLKEGYRVKTELFLEGRAKYLDKKFLEERLYRLLNLIPEEYKIADGPKRGPKGLVAILERAK